MPQACAISSMALSSAIEPVASPGARMNSGVPVSMPHRLVRRGDGRAGIERVRDVGGRLEEIVERARRGLGVMVDARSAAPSPSVPMRRVCRVGARWPTGPYICSRRSTSLTGRPDQRAPPGCRAPAARRSSPCSRSRRRGTGCGCGCFSGAMPNSPAMRPCAMARPWLGVSIDSASPSQAATIACGSIAIVVLRRRLVGRLDPLRCRGEPGLDVAMMRLAPDCRRRRSGGTKLSASSSPTRAGSAS